MINVNKQIDYWAQSAHRDLETSNILLKNNRILEGLFWSHLVIEKILKALVVNKTLDIPPRIHNLSRLVEIAEITINDSQYQLLDILMIYQLEGRYPEQYPVEPSIEEALNIFNRTKELLICLETKL